MRRALPASRPPVTEERRTQVRRDADVERDAIEDAVRHELVRQRRRWLAVWLLTLAFSAWAWDRAEVANHHVNKLAHRADTTARGAAKLAHTNCERSRVIGPEIVADYRKRHVLSPEHLATFESLIPEHC